MKFKRLALLTALALALVLAGCTSVLDASASIVTAFGAIATIIFIGAGLLYVVGCIARRGAAACQ